MQVIYHTTVEEKEELKKGYRPPKNIRQVGNPGTKRKIYIEDYVVTYLSKLAMPSNTYSRGAILLGTVKKTEEGVFIFISGALESQNFELDLEETVFTNEHWAEIYNQIGEFFPQLSIVGWFVSRLGFSTELSGKIIQTHNNYFAGDNKILYMIDSLEGDEAFYLYENHSLKKQKGYYIYYEKNEEMQNYMIERNREIQPNKRENPNVVKRDQEVLASYRRTLEQRMNKPFMASKKQEKEKWTNQKTNILKVQKPVQQYFSKRREKQNQEGGFYYIASTFLTVAILAVGITVINNYDKMLLLESTLSQMAGETKETIAKTPNSENISNSENTTSMTTANSEDTTSSTEENSTGNSPESDSSAPENAGQAELISNESKEKTSEKKSNTTSKQEKVQTNSIATYYIVKEGDTMMSISKKMYQSEKYAKKILEANEMDEEDKIFPGQKIKIPTLN